MKRCVDCKWCWWPEFATGSMLAVAQTAECRHPDLAGPDLFGPVVGDGVLACITARADHSGLCEMQARLFEPHNREPGV